MNLFKISDKAVFNILKNIEFGYLEVINHNGELFKFGNPNNQLKANLKIKNPNFTFNLIKGGSSKELIKHSTFIIAFNTTGIFEGMILNKDIIVPNFQYGKKEKNFLFNLNNKIVYLPKTKKEMILYLNLLSKIKKKTNNNKIKKKNVRFIREHLANLDGKAGQRIKNFIKQNS